MAAQENDVSHAEMQQMVRDGYARRARAVDDAGDILHALAHELERVEERRGHHHGGAVLVVVEHGDVAQLLEPALHLKTAGRADVLQVDAAKAARKQVDGAHDLVHVFALDAQGEGVHPCKLLEQHAFALHHGHARLRADVAQPQNGGAVGDHGHQVVAAGELKGLFRVVADGQAGLRHPRRIGQRQVLPILYMRARRDFQLAGPFVMLFQRFLPDIHS